MASRTAVLVDERDRRLGRCTVADTARVIRHGDGLFVRTENGIRLPGSGIGVVYEEVDPPTRNRLDPL